MTASSCRAVSIAVMSPKASWKPPPWMDMELMNSWRMASRTAWPISWETTSADWPVRMVSLVIGSVKWKKLTEPDWEE